jgi:N6-adenosine-specific RNA methylase IME4
MSAALKQIGASHGAFAGLPSIDERLPDKRIERDQLPAGHIFAGLKARHYRCVLVDAPTAFLAGTKGRPQHYPRLSDREIAGLPVADLIHPEGAFVFLWVTSPKLYPATQSGQLLSPADIVRPWGARYSARAFVWVKTKKSAANGLPFGVTADSLHRGMGYTTRKNAEDCLLFRVGAPKRLAADVDEVIFAPVREHSRKPDEAIERIERFCAGPRVELFARETRPRWDSWGDEVGRFAAEGQS